MLGHEICKKVLGRGRGWGEMEKADSCRNRNTLSEQALLLPSTKHAVGQPVYQHCLGQEKVSAKPNGKLRTTPWTSFSLQGLQKTFHNLDPTSIGCHWTSPDDFWHCLVKGFSKKVQDMCQEVQPGEWLWSWAPVKQSGEAEEQETTTRERAIYINRVGKNTPAWGYQIDVLFVSSQANSCVYMLDVLGEDIGAGEAMGLGFQMIEEHRSWRDGTSEFPAVLFLKPYFPHVWRRSRKEDEYRGQELPLAQGRHIFKEATAEKGWVVYSLLEINHSILFFSAQVYKNPPNLTVHAHWSYKDRTRGFYRYNGFITGSPLLQLHIPRWGELFLGRDNPHRIRAFCGLSTRSHCLPTFSKHTIYWTGISDDTRNIYDGEFPCTDNSICSPPEAHLRAALGIRNQALPWPRRVHCRHSPTHVPAREFSV